MARAAVRLFVSQLDFKPLYAFLLEQDRSADAQHAAACRQHLAALERRYAAFSPRAGPYFLGGDLSAADLAVLPFLDRLGCALKAHRGYHLCDDACIGADLPRLCAAMEAARRRPAWLATAVPHAVMVSAYEGYAAGRRGVPRRVRAASPDADAYAAVKPSRGEAGPPPS